MSERIYLDYNATAPARPGVASLVAELMAEPFNASSVHAPGQMARKHVEHARGKVAALVGAKPDQVIFNSGATEANNTVLKAYAGQRILVSAIEHPSVLMAAPEAELIPVTPEGVVDLVAFEEMVSRQPAPAFVSVMMVNNETGVIQPVKEIAGIAKARGAAVHTDAVQVAGRIPVDVKALGVDYLSLSAHKIGGPQGVGALVVGPCTEPPVLIEGGGQEKRRRAGTENAAGIAGFGLAAELALTDMEDYQVLGNLRDDLEARLKSVAPDLKVFGEGALRVAGTSSFTVPGVPSKTQLINLDLEGIAVSDGSACSSGTTKASHVLEAMGASPEEIGSALRVSMGWGTKPEEVQRFLDVWEKMYARVKNKADGGQ